MGSHRLTRRDVRDRIHARAAVRAGESYRRPVESLQLIGFSVYASWDWEAVVGITIMKHEKWPTMMQCQFNLFCEDNRPATTA